MRRRKTAVLLVLTALLAAGFLLWGNCSLQTTETALVSPALPPAFDGLRIVELADLHGRVFGRGSRRLLAAVLAGHCHGGVVRLPFVGGLFGTDRRLFPAWDAGLYRQGETALYVSRGLGYTNVHFRLFNRPEVAVIVLRRGSPAINS